MGNVLAVIAPVAGLLPSVAPMAGLLPLIAPVAGLLPLIAPMAGLVPFIGPVVGPAAVGLSVIVPLAILALSLFRGPDRENPTLTAIQARHQAEQAQRQAEQAAQEAQQCAQQIQRQADQDREQARVRQEEADRAAARAAEEVERIRAQMEDAAMRAQELIEAAADAAGDDAVKIARGAQEERERAQRIREDAERAMALARGEKERAQKAVDEQRREAEDGKALAEEVARTAAEETRKAIKAKEDAERRLKEGIQPVVTPSPEELAAAKRRIQYREDCFHFAVAGTSGSGKSSLVNAFRGLRSQDAGCAAVGVTETTLQITRYTDTNPNIPFVWYDVPGAGTLNCPDWQYFNEQGLYVFDFIIVLFDNRFTTTDIAILLNARRFNTPTYIVRSKADQHIRNIMREKGYDSEGGEKEDVERRKKLYEAARKQFIEETRRSVRANLQDANLPDQRVYIVSNTTLLSIVMTKMPKKTIDEVDLLKDLLKEAYTRRKASSREVE